jgi:hypothetical protein
MWSPLLLVSDGRAFDCLPNASDVYVPMGILTAILIFLSGAVCGVAGLIVGIVYFLNVRTAKLEKTSTFPDLTPKNIGKEVPILARPVIVEQNLIRTTNLTEIQQRKLICEVVEAFGLFTLEPNGYLDTLVRLQLGSQRVKTQVVTKTRNPK